MGFREDADTDQGTKTPLVCKSNADITAQTRRAGQAQVRTIGAPRRPVCSARLRTRRTRTGGQDRRTGCFQRSPRKERHCLREDGPMSAGDAPQTQSPESGPQVPTGSATAPGHPQAAPRPRATHRQRHTRASPDATPGRERPRQRRQRKDVPRNRRPAHGQRAELEEGQAVSRAGGQGPSRGRPAGGSELAEAESHRRSFAGISGDDCGVGGSRRLHTAQQRENRRRIKRVE